MPMVNKRPDNQDPYNSYVLSGLKQAQSSDILKSHFMDAPSKNETFALPAPTPPLSDAKLAGNRETFATVQPQITLFGGASAVRSGQSDNAGLGGFIGGESTGFPWWGWLIVGILGVIAAAFASRMNMTRNRILSQQGAYAAQSNLPNSSRNSYSANTASGGISGITQSTVRSRMNLE